MIRISELIYEFECYAHDIMRECSLYELDNIVEIMKVNVRYNSLKDLFRTLKECRMITKEEYREYVGRLTYIKEHYTHLLVL